jgi:general stress protein YciG
MPNNNPSGHNQYTKRKDQPMQSAGDEPSESAEHAEPDTTAASVGAPANTASGVHTPAKRGFAAMDEATQRGIASKGGQSQGKENNPGNFANDRDRAREAGRKGGESHGANRGYDH